MPSPISPNGRGLPHSEEPNQKITREALAALENAQNVAQELLNQHVPRKDLQAAEEVAAKLEGRVQAFSPEEKTSLWQKISSVLSRGFKSVAEFFNFLSVRK